MKGRVPSRVEALGEPGLALESRGVFTASKGRYRGWREVAPPAGPSTSLAADPSRRPSRGRMCRTAMVKYPTRVARRRGRGRGVEGRMLDCGLLSGLIPMGHPAEREKQ